MNQTTEDILTRENLEYDYFQVRIKKSLFTSFVQKQLMTLAPLEGPCYVNLKETPNTVYMPIDTYHRIKELVDPVYFISRKEPARISSRILISQFTKAFQKVPKEGDWCTTQIEPGDFVIQKVDNKKKTVMVKSIKSGQIMSVPFKYVTVK